MIDHIQNRARHRKYSDRQFPNLHIILAACALTMSAIFFSGQAQAQRVQPMSYELAPSGSKSSTSLRIENSSKIDMTLELMANKISIDDQGDEIRTPSDDDFLIFPPQLILKAGKTQAVRVKYIGEPSINESAPYRISIKQIPIDLSGTGRSGVGMVVNFHTLAHVTPTGAKIDLYVSKLSNQGSGKWAIAIDNRGKKMGRLSQTTWTLTDGSQSKTFSHKEVADMTERNLVMPGRTLNMIISAIEGFNASTTTVEINARG